MPYFHREAARFLTNLAAVHENHPPIISGGGIAALLIGCNKVDAMTVRFSTLGLLNLSTLAENHVPLVNAKCHQVLIDLASAKKGKVWKTLDALGELVEEQEPTSPRSRDDCQFLRDHGYAFLYFSLRTNYNLNNSFDNLAMTKRPDGMQCSP